MGTPTKELKEEFLKALKAIPNEEKEGYLQALSHNSYLLYHETPIELFLEIEKAAPLRSARRFVWYWNNRISTFPKGDAFRPLRLWNGSMNKESVKLLKSSWIMLLPPDREGRPVTFLNFSSRDCLSRGEVSLADRERCLFYILQVVCSQAESRTKGCVWIILADSTFHEANSLLLWLDRIISSFPLHIAKIHVLPVHNLGDQPEFFERFIPFSLKLLLSSKEKGFSPEDCLHVHKEDTFGSFSVSLGRHGIAREGIPLMIGGFWSQQQHHGVIDRWIEAEQKYESLKSLHETKLEFPGRSETTRGAPPKGEDIRSKMKKQRRRCQDAAMRVQQSYLEVQNERLRASIATLERLLVEAESIIGGVARSP